MRATRMALFLPLVIALGCTTPDASQEGAEQKSSEPAEDVAAVRQAIEANNAKFAAAIKAGDIPTAVAMYTPDAVVMMSEMPAMRGEAAIVEGLGGMLSQGPITDFVLTTGDVMVGGDLAVETGTFSLTQQPKTGAAMADKGKYIVVWKRQADGSWKLIRDIANSDAPKAPH